VICCIFWQAPLYLVDVIGVESSLQLNPPLNIVVPMLKQLLALWLETLASIPTLLPDPLFNSFTE